mgnify:CR=1 FL=1
MSYVTDFLGEIEVSPKNEQFNASSLVKFINEYKGNELKNWDVAFDTGTSKNQIDFGQGIKYHYPKRSFALINDGKILKISGSKRRLGNAGDGQLCLDTDQIEKVKDIASNQGIENIPQKFYFKSISRNPLLIVYVVELTDISPNTGGDEVGAESFIGNVVVGFGIGIPGLSDVETKYAKYVLNKIAIQQIFEGEIDNWDAEEEDD